MKYTYKERVIMAQKLEVFLTLIFAVGIFFIGNAIIDKSFAADNDYGTATITFNSGPDGQFEDGTTTNTVIYNLTKKVIRYSHTPNISDDGTKNSNYSNNMNTNDVVTISGASTLHVKITYGGESATYDWACVWEENHPDYTATTNYSSSISGKLGGGDYIDPSNTKEYDIEGNSVTFSFKSDGSKCGDGYGYYAVVTGESEDGELALGSIISGEYKEPISNNADYVFSNWNPDLNTIVSSTTVTATYKDSIANGNYEGIDWKITTKNELILGDSTTTQTLIENNNRVKEDYPWFLYRSLIKSIKMAGNINAKGSLNEMFSSGDFGDNGYTNVVDINLNKLNTNNITNMSKMFSGCKKLETLNISGFNTTNVTNMRAMFAHCEIITQLDVSNFDTSNVSNTNEMFTYCLNLTYLDVSHFNTSNVTDMSYMFNYCEKLEVLDVSNFDTSNVTNMESMFEHCYKLNVLDVSNFDTSQVTNMQGMFDGCGEITNLDVSGFDTSQVTDMASMFWCCENLNVLNVSNFDTRNVTNMIYMFYGCDNLTSLDVSGFDTSQVTEMQAMFENCSNLEELDVSNFDTHKVTDMRSMFNRCGKIRALNISNFDTRNVTNMESMFEDCYNLTNLDLNSFNTENVTTMKSMFAGSEKLTTIDISNFNTSNVTNMSYMFDHCEKLSDLDVSNFNTSNVTNMDRMFYMCKKIQSLDLSNFNTSIVTSMANIFTNADQLNTLKLGTNWSFLSNNKLSKSWLRDGDITVYTAEELTDSYNGSTMAGTYRAVQKLTITEQVKGSFADINKNFEFTINARNDGVGINSTHAYAGSKTGNLVFDNGDASFSLKHNESIYTYLPYGVSYTINQDNDGYTLVSNSNTGTLTSDQTASFTDTLNGTTPTGVFLNIIPYIIMLIIGTVGLLWIRSFKRI